MAETWTILKVLQWTQRRFAERGLGSPRLDAEVLLADLVGLDRVGLYTHFDQPLSPDELAAYRERIRRRLAGEPVAYVLGRREFWSLSLAVDARVLVPRPETEGAVEAAIALLDGREAPAVADVCTGSGAIALAIARERPDARVVGADVSPDAIEVARGNARRLGLAVDLVVGDLLAPLGDRPPFDLVVANPPYVASDEIDHLAPEVRREPRLALDGGADGLDVVRRLVPQARGRLVDGGCLVLEIGATQGAAAAALCRAAGFSSVEVRRDLAGLERIVVARR